LRDQERFREELEALGNGRAKVSVHQTRGFE